MEAFLLLPNEDMRTIDLDPTHASILSILGGHYRRCFPRWDDICILMRTWKEDELPLRAHRDLINRWERTYATICGPALVLGFDSKTKTYRELTMIEKLQVFEDYMKPCYKDYGSFDLEPGEEVLITSGINFNRNPKSVRVVREYPRYILLEAVFPSTGTYRFSVNKANFLCDDDYGHVRIIRQRTGTILH